MQTSTEQLFTEARTARAFVETPVSDDTLHQLYELLKFGPTASNCCPARFVFVRTAAQRERLAQCVSAGGNQAKVRNAPVTVVIGMDLAFYEQLPRLFPHVDARSWYAGKPDVIRHEALRSSSLQAAYLIIAARALGLDAAPMGGIDAAKMDAEFFAGTPVKSHMVCCLGHADHSVQRPRSPRLAFDEACRLA
jgi:3-hydroxypropanoate dehydrogenase